MDGIETATALQQKNIPVIYVTANTDDATFNRAKVTRPAAFISKPFKQLDLQRAIELTISRMANKAEEADIGPDEATFILSDRIFIRQNGKMVKLMLMDIIYLEADRNYSRIFTKQKNYLVSFTLKNIEERLTIPYLMRIHRSYVVNLMYVDEVLEANVMMGDKALPLGNGMREELMQRLKTL